MGGESLEHRITDIHCPQCGAPADFDIVRQMYVCGHCGGSAEVVFEENEALSGCPFCGRSLVRTEYLSSKNMPESVIPFGITQKEAEERLEEWCRKNRGKQEAKQLLPLISELKGFYLPYEMVRGPVHMRASRMDAESVYRCEGFMENAFVNCSKQLDNLLLDGMEPFDMNGLTGRTLNSASVRKWRSVTRLRSGRLWKRRQSASRLLRNQLSLCRYCFRFTIFARET